MRLQARKFAILAQRRKRAVDRLAQRLVLFGERNPEFLAGRHLDRATDNAGRFLTSHAITG